MLLWTIFPFTFLLFAVYMRFYRVGVSVLITFPSAVRKLGLHLRSQQVENVKMSSFLFCSRFWFPPARPVRRSFQCSVGAHVARSRPEQLLKLAGRQRLALLLGNWRERFPCGVDFIFFTLIERGDRRRHEPSPLGEKATFSAREWCLSWTFSAHWQVTHAPRLPRGPIYYCYSSSVLKYLLSPDMRQQLRG